MERRTTYAVGGGVLIGAIAWLDPIFIPLVLIGPLVTGFVTGWRGAPYRYAAGAWALGGALMLVSDAIVNHEDKAFHAALTVVMVVLVGGGWLLGRFFSERRFRKSAPSGLA